jgi:hypothetical protein
VHRYRRHLPNALSRLVECTCLARQFDGALPLLVLGDLPLRCVAPQTVFVQTPHLIGHGTSHSAADSVKFAVARQVFRWNVGRATAFIVQTPVMRAALISSHPELAAKVHVVGQPVPDWLLNSGLKRRARQRPLGAKLGLIYPAAGYRHKNHRLLAHIDPATCASWPIERLTLTLPPEASPAPALPWVDCCGFLSAHQMIDAYRQAEALLFLSTDESYGFPLIEAMYVGLPIVCPDRPYARVLCGDGAIYFDPQSITSLQSAVSTLYQRLAAGWWPDWTARLENLPRDWASVARSMMAIATDG